MNADGLPETAAPGDPAPPPGLVVVGRYDQLEGYGVNRPRGADSWLFTWTTGGHGRLRQGGAETRAGAGDLVVLAPGVRHEYAVEPAARSWQFWWVHCQARPSWVPWLRPYDTGDGLFVVTPFNGTYFQFDGRQSKDDIRSADPQSLAATIRTTYIGDALDVRQYQKVEPLLVTILEPGVALVVSNVRVDRDRVRLYFSEAQAPEATTATSLLIQWPTTFSRGFTERAAVESLIHQYIQLPDAAAR